MSNITQPPQPLDQHTAAWQAALFVLLHELDARGLMPASEYVKALENRVAFGQAIQEPQNPVLQRFASYLAEQFPTRPTPDSRAG